MSREKAERNQRMIRFGVLITILLLAMYAFFDLTKRLEDAKSEQKTPASEAEREPATPEAETGG